MQRNTRIYLTVMIIIALISSFMTVYAQGSRGSLRSSISGLSAKSAALYIPESNEFIYEKSASTRMPMASTTKIMTAIIAAEYTNPSDTVIIDARAVGTEGSSAYLKAGEAVTMEELLYALLLQSANDAAAAIAYHISGTIEDFASLMNEKAKSLSLSDTHFTNPHGLDNEEHYTTARELAIIARSALEIDILRTAFKTYKRTFKNGERCRTYVNHNKLLKLYDGALGVKTGFTKKSGRCLVGAAERDGLLLITVTLDAPSDWNDHEKMLDFGFDNYEKLTLAAAGELRYERFVFNSLGEKLTLTNRDELTLIRRKTDGEIKALPKLPCFVYAPLDENTVLGKVIFTENDKYIGEINLYPEKEITVEKEKRGFFIFGK